MHWISIRQAKDIMLLRLLLLLWWWCQWISRIISRSIRRIILRRSIRRRSHSAVVRVMIIVIWWCHEGSRAGLWLTRGCIGIKVSRRRQQYLYSHIEDSCFLVYSWGWCDSWGMPWWMLLLMLLMLLLYVLLLLCRSLARAVSMRCWSENFKIGRVEGQIFCQKYLGNKVPNW